MASNFESQFVPYNPRQRAGTGSALVFAPHPDDEVIGCGGAILRHLETKDPVHVIIVTDGRMGDPELAMRILRQQAEPEEVIRYIKMRQDESREAAGSLGYAEPKFWDAHDRELTCDPERVARVVETLERFQPACVYGPSVHEMHPDHRAVTLLLLEALPKVNPRPDLYMYEIGRPMPGPDLLVDITDIWPRMEKAIQCFKSQLRICPFDEYARALNRFRSFTLPPRVIMAEGYMTVPGSSPEEAYLGLLSYMERDLKKQLFTLDGNAIKGEKSNGPAGKRNRLQRLLRIFGRKHFHDPS